jgi:sugar/nucleoside kinase (ribokinase family)
LIFHNRRKYKLPEFKKALWVYLTAMAENGSQIYNDLEKYIKKHKAKLGFNPGTYHIKSGLEKILKLIELSHVLILNVEETIELFKPNKTDFAKRKELVLYLLNYVKDHGPDIVLITDGKKGAYAYDGETYWHIPIFGSKPIERTGAGDSFSTGFISALMHDKSIPEALVWGSLNADSVIQYVGPQAGLLTKKQILEIIKKNPDYKAKRIKKPT